MSVVFGLSGTGVIPHYLPLFFGGEVTDGNTFIPVVYPSVPTFATVDFGATLLDAAMADYPIDHKVVFGHSLGSLVAHHWMNTYGPTTTIPDADLEFLLVGNPARKYGGMLNYKALGPVSPYVEPMATLCGDLPLPAYHPWQITDFTRQYDGWSDCPDVIEPIAAVNALIGGVTTHIDYTTQSLAALNPTLVEGTVTYVWSRTVPCPIDALTTLGLAGDDIYRRIIEKSYMRPVDIETFDPDGPPSLDDLDAISEQVEYYRRYQSQL